MPESIDIAAVAALMSIIYNRIMFVSGMSGRQQNRQHASTDLLVIWVLSMVINGVTMARPKMKMPVITLMASIKSHKSLNR